MASDYIWPVGGGTKPDEMNTSFGPRIDADRWDFHDGIDLPAPLGTPLRAMRAGKVIRAGPGEPNKAAKGIHSQHVFIETVDVSGETIFLVYLHLDSIAPKIFPGAPVNQDQIIGTVGEDDATYPHLHFEFRRGDSNECASVHPLRYLPYSDPHSFTDPVLAGVNRCASSVTARLRFQAGAKAKGDLLRVVVDLLQAGKLLASREVNCDDKTTIQERKGDQHRFKKQNIALEGYQKSNMGKEGRADLQFGILIRRIPPGCDALVAHVNDVCGNATTSPPLPIPDGKPVDESIDFEGSTGLPPGWSEGRSTSGTGCVVIRDPAAAHSGSHGLRCVDASTTESDGQRACLERTLPPGRIEWAAGGWFNPIAVELAEGRSLLMVRFSDAAHLLAAAHLHRGKSHFSAGITVRKDDGTLKSENSKVMVALSAWRKWRLHLRRIATREATAILSVDGKEVARLNWDATGREPRKVRMGIATLPAGATATMH